MLYKVHFFVVIKTKEKAQQLKILFHFFAGGTRRLLPSLAAAAPAAKRIILQYCHVSSLIWLPTIAKHLLNYPFLN